MSGFDPKAFRAQKAGTYRDPFVNASATASQQSEPSQSTTVTGKIFKPWYDSGVLTAPSEDKGFWRSVGEDALTLGLAPAALAGTAIDLVLHPIKTTKQVGSGVVQGVKDMFSADEWKAHPLLNLVNTVANVSVVGGLVKGVSLSTVRSAAINEAKTVAVGAGIDSTIVNSAFKGSNSTVKAALYETVKTGSSDAVVSTLKNNFMKSGLDVETATRLATETTTKVVDTFMKNNAGKIATMEAVTHPVAAFGKPARYVSESIGKLVFGSPEKSAVGKLYGSAVVKNDVAGFGQLEQWAAMQVEERGWKPTVENRVRTMQEWVDSNPEYAALTPEERVAHFKEYAQADLIRQEVAKTTGREYVLTKALPRHYVDAMKSFTSSQAKELTNMQVVEKLSEAYGKDFSLHQQEVIARLGDAAQGTDRTALDNALNSLANNRIPVTLDKLTVTEEKMLHDLEGSGYRIGRAPTKKIVSQAADVVTGAGDVLGKTTFTKEDLVASRTVLGKLVDKLGLSPQGNVEGVQAFAFREAFTQGLFKEFGKRTTILINGVKYPIESLAENLKRLSDGALRTSSVEKVILPTFHTIADLRYNELVKLGFEKADAKILDRILRESSVVSPSITGIGEALSNYVRTRNNPLSRKYNNFLRIQSDLRFRKNPMFGLQAAVEATVWGNMWSKTIPGSRTVTRSIEKVFGMKTPIVASLRESTLGEQQAVLTEVMDEFQRQLRDAGMAPEIERGLMDDLSARSLEGKGIPGVIKQAKFHARNADSNIWLGAAGFSNVRLATNLFRSYAGRFGMELEEALNYTIKDGKKVYDHPWMVENMRSAAQGIFGYKTGILTSPLIRTMNTVFFPIRFQTKTLIQTADWLGSLSPASRLAVINQWTATAHWLTTPEGDKWRNENRGLFASLFNYVFAFEGMGKTVDAATRGQLFGGNAGLIGGLPFGFIANIARDLGYVPQDVQINTNTGKPYDRKVVKDTASFAAFVTTVEDIVISMTPAMPFTTATGGAITVSMTRGVKQFIEQGLTAIYAGATNQEAKDVRKEMNRDKIKVKPGYYKKLPNPLNLLLPKEAEASTLSDIMNPSYMPQQNPTAFDSFSSLSSFEKKPSKQSYTVRGNVLSDDDLQEARAILYGEISNRSKDKQLLEAKTILNTALNRMEEYRKHGKNYTLTQVLQMPNQYQAYTATVRNEKGVEVDSQYTMLKKGAQGLSEQRLAAVDETLESVKNGTFKNNIGSNVFYYVHEADGRIIVDTKRKLFK